MIIVLLNITAAQNTGGARGYVLFAFYASVWLGATVPCHAQGPGVTSWHCESGNYQKYYFLEILIKVKEKKQLYLVL